jgi:N-acetylneuraminic acid mutarotase
MLPSPLPVRGLRCVACGARTEDRGILNTSMKKTLLLALLFLPVLTAVAEDQYQPLPSPVTNNAVAVVKIDGQLLVYSFMGLGPAKTWKAVSNVAYALNLKYDKWTAIRPAPGSGRLGTVAVGAAQQVFLFGGYVVDPSGLEQIVPDLSIYDPTGLRWHNGPDMPVPVRDAVAGAYRDRYIYVVGGLSQAGPTNQVQIYDAEEKKWLQGTPSPGAPVFGHAGNVTGDTIVYVDGGARSPTPGPLAYVASDECWMGKIDHRDPRKIEWKKLPAHPGAARYRIAAGGSEKEQRIYFAGGSDTVYDYTGISPSGKLAEPSPVIFALNLKNDSWETVKENNPKPTMDHHGLIVTSDGLVVIGGMAVDQKVVGTVEILPTGN